MYQGTRKFVTNQRSVPKQGRASYQQVATNEKQFNHPYYAQYGSKKQLIKTSSDADLRHPKEQYFKNLNQRRKNQGQMSNLKSQLQNLKNEVNKLISKQSSIRTPQKQRLITKQQRSDKKINYASKFHDEFTDRQQDFSDTASMASVTTQKVLNQPLRKLQKKITSQNYDQGYYMQLENQLLKTQIKNLKNKYVSKKRQLTQRSDLLEKKTEFLEVSLQKSQESLIQCRKALEMQIMVIKRQITLKTEIKNENQPETDKVDVQGNDMLKQKIKRLYDDLTQKNKTINNFNIQLGDLEGTVERKKFELKKQSQKNSQLSKQIELSKRQNFRLQQLIQTQLSKKKDLAKQNQQLKQKNKELMNQIYAKQQIVSGSQQYENRMTEELQQYKRKQDEMHQKLTILKDQNRKLKQMVQSDKDQINYLKKNNEDTISRIAQLSKKLKQEQQKSFQKQDYYRRVLQQSKRKEEEKIKILKDHYQSQTAHINDQVFKKQENQSFQVNEIIREKDRQINKWKAEYKILKLKHQEKQTSEQVRRQEIDEYYKGYNQYKHSTQLLQQRNKILEKSIEKYLKKLNQKQALQMRLQLQHKNEIEDIKIDGIRLKNDLQNSKDQLMQVKSHLAQVIFKNDQQIKYRQQVQQKIQKFIHKQLNGQSSENQEEFEEVQNNQNIESLNSTPQKQKRFAQDEQNQQSPRQQTKQKKPRKQKKSKTQQIKPQIELTQSEKLQLEQLSQAITSIKKRVIQQDEKLSKNIRELKNKDTQINKLKKQIRQLLQTQEKQLLQLKQKYATDKVQILIKTSLDAQKQIRQLCQKQVQTHKTKYSQILLQNVQMKRKISEIQKQLLDLRQQTKSLSHLYNVKCGEVQQIVQKATYQLGQKQKRLDELNLLRHQKQTNLLNQISNFKDQITSLRIQIKNLTSLNKKIESHSFDEALKNQIQSNKTLREQLAKKNQQLFKVRDNYTLIRSQYDNLRSQSQIQKLKSISEKKNIEVQYQIQQQNLKNKLSVEEKKISSLQQKIALVIQENKKKDSFIQSYIMGKKLPQSDKEFVSQFLKQYQILLNGKSINDKLRADSHELQKMAQYNYRLLKDMAEMKEKMLLYETMQGEALSLYDSRQCGEINRQNDFDSPHTPKKEILTPNKKFKKMNSLIDSHNDLDLGDRSK